MKTGSLFTGIGGLEMGFSNTVTSTEDDVSRTAKLAAICNTCTPPTGV